MAKEKVVEAVGKSGSALIKKIREVDADSYIKDAQKQEHEGAPYRDDVR
jgi:hypothetical protein